MSPGARPVQIQPGLTPPLATVRPTSAPTAATDPAPLSVAEDSKVPGVIRNLQNGHYKGFADVRLRIVHAEKLAALQAQQFAGALDGAADSLAGALEPVVNDLMAELDAAAAAAVDAADPAAIEGEAEVAATDVDPNPLDSFRAALAAALAGGVNTAATFTDAAQTAFQTLLDQLGLNSVAAEPAAAEETADPAPAGTTDGTDETTGALVADASEVTEVEVAVAVEADAAVVPRDDLAELTAAFDAALATILERAGAASALPPLSEPNGNGAAYAKFLTMYNDLQADSSVAADTTSAMDTGEPAAATGGLDIEV